MVIAINNRLRHRKAIDNGRQNDEFGNFCIDSDRPFLLGFDPTLLGLRLPEL